MSLRRNIIELSMFQVLVEYSVPDTYKHKHRSGLKKLFDTVNTMADAQKVPYDTVLVR
jgi:hypothetical protein